jgi:hypothetical protein
MGSTLERKGVKVKKKCKREKNRSELLNGSKYG